jgi:ketosteroid isomerase-like protein
VELWELTAREEIRDLIARYNANGDTGRFDQVVDLFADDAVMISQGQTYRGKAGVQTVFGSAALSTPRRQDDECGACAFRGGAANGGLNPRHVARGAD